MKRYLQKIVYCGNRILSGEDRFWEEMDREDLKKEASLQKEGILYITDDEKILKALKMRQVPVAVWFHEENREQDLSEALYGVEAPEVLKLDFYERVYRREKGIPWDILETKRCIVREMIPEDGRDFARIYQDPIVRTYMKDFHTDAEGEAQYIREYQQRYRFYEYGVWSILLKETGQVIGRAGFSETEEESIPCLGYVIDAEWRRQGLAYEVCSAILDYAKDVLEFEQIYLYAEKGNVASLKLAEKLGMNIIPFILQP